MKQITLLFALLVGTLAQAAPLSYSFLVDTSTFNTMNGQINLQFNPGIAPPADAASAVISGYSGGTLGSVVSTDGDVTGGLGTTLTLNNGQPLNRLVQNITFGTSLQFSLTISGSLLDNPSDLFNGSAFALQFSQGSTDTIPIYVDITPFLGVTEIFDSSVSQVTAVPEPSALWLVGLAIPAICWRRKRS